MRAVETLQEFGREKQVGAKDLFALSLALEECGTNIISYGLKRDSQQTFQAGFEYTGTAITVELRDQGPEFDPTKLDPPAAPSLDEDRPPGGWGIQLVRKYMDNIVYRREGEENVLRLTRKLGAREHQE